MDDGRTIGLALAGVGVVVLAVRLARRSRPAHISSGPIGIPRQGRQASEVGPAAGLERASAGTEDLERRDLSDRPLPRSVAALHSPPLHPAP